MDYIIPDCGSGAVKVPGEALLDPSLSEILTWLWRLWLTASSAYTYVDTVLTIKQINNYHKSITLLVTGNVTNTVQNSCPYIYMYILALEACMYQCSTQWELTNTLPTVVYSKEDCSLKSD